MQRNRNSFVKHDETRYVKFLMDAVTLNLETVNVGALKPHNITALIDKNARPADMLLANVQWKAMVEHLRTKGSLSNAMAVCDVSASMNGLPMNACIAFGLLIATLTKQPWQDHVISFSATPRFHEIPKGSLAEKMSFIKELPWSMNTNFESVFDLILSTALREKVPEADMVKTLFVFSDMEFDQASADSTDKKTAFERIVEKFEKAGYAMPQLIFWNLRETTINHTPVRVDDTGAALVSGYSANILRLFLEGALLQETCGAKKEQLNPETVMRKAIDNRRYNCIET